MKITKVREVRTPERGTTRSAGIDFFIPEGFADYTLIPGQTVKIPSGIHAKVPEGYALIAFNKSGIATKKVLQVGACVVDEDYQGEIHLNVTNIGVEPQVLKPGDKLVQMILIEVLYADISVVESLDDLYSGEITERGDGGFGSTN